MMNTERHCADLSRDPVARVIEQHLRSIGVAEYGSLAVREDGGEFIVSFAAATARGETHDIALIRLAQLLLDDQRFAKELIGPLAAMTRN